MDTQQRSSRELTPRERSNANLIPYKKGQSGNPKGPRVKRRLLAAIEDLLDGHEAEFLTYSKPVRDLAISIVEMSHKDGTFMRELWTRLEGHVPKSPPPELPRTTVIVQTISAASTATSSLPGTAPASAPDATTLPGSPLPESSDGALQPVPVTRNMPVLPVIGTRVEVQTPSEPVLDEDEDDEEQEGR